LRKSDRIRILELEVLRQQYELEYLKITMEAILEANKLNIPTSMDAGKWYSPSKKKD
jgi:hypothetical protein